MFISLGFSHVITSINIIALNGLVVVAWHLCNVLNTSVEVQLYVTIVAGVLATWGLYYYVDYIREKRPSTYSAMQRFVEKYSVHRSGIMMKIGDVLDKHNIG
jgi:hypothetical protein